MIRLIMTICSCRKNIFQEEFAGVVARVESLRWRMGASQSARQVEGLFESLLAEAFDGHA